MTVRISDTRRKAKSISAIEEKLALHIRVNKLPEPEREHRFHELRKWRFDFAWADQKVAAECEGGVWILGRHNRGSGFSADLEKYNAAAELGWRVFRFTGDQISKGEAIMVLQRVLA